MKIIAQTHNTFILEAHKDEIAKLTGFHGVHDSQGPKLEPGVEVNVNGMFRALYSLSNQKTALTRTATTLRAMADLLEAESPVIDALAEEAKRQ